MKLVVGQVIKVRRFARLDSWVFDKSSRNATAKLACSIAFALILLESVAQHRTTLSRCAHRIFLARRWTTTRRESTWRTPS